METALNIVPISRDKDWGPATISPNPTPYGPYSAPAYPDGVEVETQPDSIVMWRKPSPLPQPSWAEVKKSGSIRMTPYEAETLSVSHFIGGRSHCAVRFELPFLWSGAPVNACHGIHEVKLATHWREQGDIRYWSDKFDAIPLNPYDKSQLGPLVDTTRTSAIAAFKGGYDPLTELAEARQGLSFFKESADAAYRLLGSFLTDYPEVEGALRRNKKIRPIDLLKSANRRLRQAGSAWLAYRYAIMPLVYSYRDISDLVRGQNNTYQSYRSSSVLEIEPPEITSSGLWDLTSGQVTVSSVIRAGYSNDFLRTYVSNQLQVNPFATAWELIPYSFVFDWFVNVGDFIVATTSADYSAQAMGCTSIKTRLTTETVLANKVDTTFLQTYNYSNPCFPVGTRTLTYPFKTDTEELVMSTSLEHFVRTPFELNTGALALSPSMNWKRWVDASALSHSRLSKLLRSFKR